MTRTAPGCSACKDGAPDFALAMAFQPIVDLDTGLPFAFEALVRGTNGEGAAQVRLRSHPGRLADDLLDRPAPRLPGGEAEHPFVLAV